MKYKLIVNGKVSGSIETENVAEFIKENYKTSNFTVNGKSVHLTISMGQAMRTAMESSSQPFIHTNDPEETCFCEKCLKADRGGI